MAFKDFPDQHQGIALLQRSLQRQRLAHGYLFTGHEVGTLEALARTLAKTLNCQAPVQRGVAGIDSCDECLSCRKIEHGNHADVHWVRPESKTRIITVEQVRDLIKEIHLKPNEAEYKVAVVVAADRLRTEAASAFLKTLEEPPPKSILILLTSEPQRIIETILSRCLRLNFGGEGLKHLPKDYLQWLGTFSEMAAADQKSLIGRYRLMDVLLQKLTALKAAIETALTARSPLQHYQDAEKDVMEKWESELSAAVEAEYRRQRTDLLGLLQCWLRDIWVLALARQQNNSCELTASDNSISATPSAEGASDLTRELLNFPGMPGVVRVAQRISPAEAMENLQVLEQLQRWLGTNVQEALALEVGLLKLRL